MFSQSFGQFRSIGKLAGTRRKSARTHPVRCSVRGGGRDVSVDETEVQSRVTVSPQNAAAMRRIFRRGNVVVELIPTTTCKRRTDREHEGKMTGEENTGAGTAIFIFSRKMTSPRRNFIVSLCLTLGARFEMWNKRGTLK